MTEKGAWIYEYTSSVWEEGNDYILFLGARYGPVNDALRDILNSEYVEIDVNEKGEVVFRKGGCEEEEDDDDE